MPSQDGGTAALREALRDLVESLGYECVGTEWVKESGRPVLRVYIDSIGGILIDDCSRVSRHLNGFLDSHADDLPSQYTLEVSSPGLERPLFGADDYRRFIGHKAHLRLFRKVEGQKKASGVISAVTADSVLIQLDDGSQWHVPFEVISRAHLVYEGLPKGKKEKHL